MDAEQGLVRWWVPVSAFSQILPGVLSILFGLVLTYVMGRALSTLPGKLQDARRLRAASLREIGAVEPDAGLVEIAGTVQATDQGVLHAPVADDDAVLRHVETVKFDAGDGEQNRYGRHFEAVPFDVDDGSGRARVEIPDADFDDLSQQELSHLSHSRPALALDRSTEEFPYVEEESETEDETPQGQSESEQTAQAQADHEPIPETLSELFEMDFDRKRDCEFRERSVAPGESIYVAGHAQQAPANADADVVITGEDESGDVVVGESQDAVESGLYVKLVLLTLLALLLFVVGLGLVFLGVAVTTGVAP